MTKIKTGLVVVVVAFLLITFGPQLATLTGSGDVPNPRARPTLVMGPRVWQFPKGHPYAHNGDELSEAEWDRDGAVLYVTWRGNRTLRITWYDGIRRTAANPYVDDPVGPLPGTEYHASE